MPEANKALVQRLFEEVFNTRLLAVADDLLAPGHIYHDTALPDAEIGPNGMKRVLATFRRGFSDLRWIVDEMVGADDMVVTRWVGHGTHTGAFLGVPPTGKQVTMRGIWMHRIAGPRIAESWNQWDTLGVLQQIGAVPGTVVERSVAPQPALAGVGAGRAPTPLPTHILAQLEAAKGEARDYSCGAPLP